MRKVIEAVLAAMDAGRPCVLASAVGGEGSAPRKTRAHMLVGESGRICGTVGGGAVEWRSIQLGMQICASGGSCDQTFELSENSPYGLGMVCGGRVSIHFLYISPRDVSVRAAVLRAAGCIAGGEKAWLLIDLDAHALSVFRESELPSDLKVYQNEAAFRAGQSDKLYGEQLVSAGRVYIFGGGHVAQALVPVLASVDFRCVIIEDREEFCQRSLFPDAEDVRLISGEAWEEALSVMPEDYICIMTRGHKNDLACQAFAMRTKAAYIGVIGSRKKIASVNERLRSMGFTDEDLSRIVTPIGLDIGAQTPAEIAISIAAQMIAERAGKRIRF